MRTGGRPCLLVLVLEYTHTRRGDLTSRHSAQAAVTPFSPNAEQSHKKKKKKKATKRMHQFSRLALGGGGEGGVNDYHHHHPLSSTGSLLHTVSALEAASAVKDREIAALRRQVSILTQRVEDLENRTPPFLVPGGSRALSPSDEEVTAQLLDIFAAEPSREFRASELVRVLHDDSRGLAGAKKQDVNRVLYSLLHGGRVERDASSNTWRLGRRAQGSSLRSREAGAGSSDDDDDAKSGDAHSHLGGSVLSLLVKRDAIDLLPSANPRGCDSVSAIKELLDKWGKASAVLVATTESEGTPERPWFVTTLSAGHSVLTSRGAPSKKAAKAAAHDHLLTVIEGELRRRREEQQKRAALSARVGSRWRPAA